MKKISLQGNKGGDLLDIEVLKDDRINLRVGNNCVMMVEKAVPVEFITKVIANEILEHGSVESVIESFAWDKKYLELLKGKVSEWECE